jgi:hypothetical protein
LSLIENSTTSLLKLPLASNVRYDGLIETSGCLLPFGCGGKTYANRHDIHSRPVSIIYLYKAPAAPDRRLRNATFFNEKYHFARVLTPPTPNMILFSSSLGPSLDVQNTNIKK